MRVLNRINAVTAHVVSTPEFVVIEGVQNRRYLPGAKLFVGNMLSTFSTNVANIRYGHGGRRSVLAW